MDCRLFRRIGARATVIDPTVLILFAALAVHVVRRNVFDVLIFAGTILLSAVDRVWPLPVGAARRVSVRQLFAPRWMLFAVVVVFGLGIGLLVGWPARVALAVPGLLAVVLVLTGRPSVAVPARHTRSVGRVVWAGLLIIAALIELSSFLQQPDPQTGSYAHPTLSTLIEPIFSSPLARVLGLTLWLATGWWLVGACRRPADDARSAPRSTDRRGGPAMRDE